MATNLILIRGGGDLASGVALRLYHAGFGVVITELPQPLAVRRRVAFAEAVYANQVTVEDVSARKAHSAAEALAAISEGLVAVLVDPQAELLTAASFAAVIDARLMKRPAERLASTVPLSIGLGPGFTAGENVDAVVETQRGHNLGRVYWQGSAQADTGQPEGDPRRVLRAPLAGILHAHVEIGEHVKAGQVIARIGRRPLEAPFAGMLRGLIHPGIRVLEGMKVGDVDPRDKREYCYLVSDKALAIGGGVLEALLARRTPHAEAQDEAR